MTLTSSYPKTYSTVTIVALSVLTLILLPITLYLVYHFFLYSLLVILTIVSVVTVYKLCDLFDNVSSKKSDQSSCPSAADSDGEPESSIRRRRNSAKVPSPDLFVVRRSRVPDVQSNGGRCRPSRYSFEDLSPASSTSSGTIKGQSLSQGAAPGHPSSTSSATVTNNNATTFYGSSSFDQSSSNLTYKRRSGGSGKRPSLTRSDAIIHEHHPVSPTHSHYSDSGGYYYSSYPVDYGIGYYQPRFHTRYNHPHDRRHQLASSGRSSGHSRPGIGHSFSSESGSMSEEDPLVPYLMSGGGAPPISRLQGHHVYGYPIGPHQPFYYYGHHPHNHRPEMRTSSSTSRISGYLRSSNSRKRIPEEWTNYDRQEADVVDEEEEDDEGCDLKKHKFDPKSRQHRMTHHESQPTKRSSSATGHRPMRHPSLGNCRQANSFDRETTTSTALDDGPLSETATTSIRSLSRQTTFSSMKEQDIQAITKMEGNGQSLSDVTTSTAIPRSASVVASTSGQPMRPICGYLELTYSYDPGPKKLTVILVSAQELTLKESVTQLLVKVTLLGPGGKRQKSKTKSTSIADDRQSVTFEGAKFVYNKINPKEVPLLTLRLRVKSATGSYVGGHSVLAESSLPFSKNRPLLKESTIRLALEARSSHRSAFSRSNSRNSDISSSGLSRSESGLSNYVKRPELLLGLSFNPTTGRLYVNVIKGSQLRSPSSFRPPDTYVKLTLISSAGREMSRSKTSTKKGQPNPTFKESFVFQVALFQLPDVSLIVSVYNKSYVKRKELIGWFSVGKKSSGSEELSHWTDMRDADGEELSRWHVLHKSPAGASSASTT